MKRLTCLLLSLLMVIMMAGCGSQSEPEAEKDQLARIQERGSIIIATEGNWAPWTYHDSEGNLIGFDVELGRLLAAELGVKAQFEEAIWDSIFSGIDSGLYDIACNGVGYTEDRAQNYSFSQPYVYTKKALIVAADNDSITKFEDLNGKKTANTASSTYAEIARKYGAEVIPVDSLNQTIDMLVRGEIDATVNSQDSFNTYMQVNPDARIKVAAFSSGEKVAIPMVKDPDSATLLEAINRAIDTLRANGKLAELSIKYFGTDNTSEN